MHPDAFSAPDPVGSDTVDSSPVQLRTNAAGVLVCELSAGPSFEQLRTAVRETLTATEGRLRGQTVRLDIGRRDFDLFDLRRLINVLKDEFGVQVVGIHCPSEALARFAERELKVRVHPSQPPAPPPLVMPEPPPVVVPPPSIAEPPLDDADAVADDGRERTMTLHGTVRSGAVIRFAGDVQVFGDVNPGAQILAGGSVYVYGALKGLACAGARGDTEQVILAFDMRPNQLRIARAIQIPTQSPDRPSRYTPEIAYLSGDSIVIEAYRGRHPHQRENS